MKHIRTARAGSALIADPTSWAWQDHAACKGDEDLFFAPDRERLDDQMNRIRDAKQICAACPVLSDCLDYALSLPPIAQNGIWGGMTEDERTWERNKRLRRERLSAKATPKPKPKKKPKKDPVRRIDASGSRRRLESSSAVGRRLKLYSQLSGVSESFLSKVRAGQIDVVREDIAKKIADAYPVVLARVGDVAREPLGAAAMGGWPLPEAWEGVDIDDPAAQPRTMTTAA
ncbi:WhiB family transcriptional regulator [Nocardiopsis synnemataformans]|uniref:WhiB family transcriptional regulator n=1 Tax=Nocardiopsis synnemataformans TaxID=61305 RepID=UPI003EBE7C5C